MSHTAYDLTWQDAMNDLTEQIKTEYEPAEPDEAGKPQIEGWPDDEKFQYLCVLYIKYIEIYRKLEDCYDQSVHPQKRVAMKQTLEATILRICELKHQITLFNPRRKSIYVHLDQLLFDLKYDPSVIEIPVPRYFSEDDRNEIELKFKEKVQKDGAKKKKAGKKKKKKKKKDAEEEKKPPPMPLVEKQQLMSNLLGSYSVDEPEIEIVKEYFTFALESYSFYEAIRHI